jgi:regulator of protease activity HflC (stomatin/prohibitin superfamily)
MITTTIVLVFFFVSAGLLIATRQKMYVTKEVEGPTGAKRMVRVFNLRWIMVPVAIFIIGFIIGQVQPYVVERVDAGHIGIKVNLTGNARGVSDYTYKTGWVAYNTWTESLYEFPTYQQHIEYTDQEVITKGGFRATIRPSFNYSLVPTAVGDMFQNLRITIKEVEQGWLKTAIVGSVNDVANRWTVDDVFNKREEFEAAIVAECNKRISKWFTVSQLRTNITPPPALQAAIEAKTKAIQEVQVAENQKKVAEAEGYTMIARAKADSAQNVIKASGEGEAMLRKARAEAEAVKVKQREITSLYNEYLKITKWDGVNPTTVLGGNSSTMVVVK